MAVARTVGVRYLWCVLAACSAAQPSAPAPTPAPSGVGPDGAAVTLELAGDRITAVRPGGAADTWLWPPIVDSHVHLAYFPVAEQLAAHGVGAAVDLAAPERTLGARMPLQLVTAGPMLTRPGGYPLDAWGEDGYGVGCADATCVRATVARLADEGARVIKLPLDADGLAPDLVPVAVDAAHARGLEVAVHALGDAAGLDDAAITDAMTTAPLAYWGLDLGLARGREATFLVLDRDPRRDAFALLAPRLVISRGAVIARRR